MQEAKEECSKRDEVQNIAEEWKELQTTILKTAGKILGERRHVRNEGWYDQECKEAIQLKNSERQKTIQRKTRSSDDKYREGRRKENRTLQKKKKEYSEKEVEKIEELRSNNETKKFYQAITNMKSGFQPRVNACKDRQGKVLSEENDVKKRWVEYFHELLNVENQ